MTDQPASLAAALVAFQTEIPRIRKTARGNYGAYADLEHVNAIVLPAIARYGLAFTAWPTLNEAGRFVLAYQLLHVGGDSMAGEYELPQNAQPQQIGSAITYARRYSLLAVTGVAPAGDDDDGQAAQSARRPRQQAARASGPPPERAPANLPRNRDGSVSRSQTTDAELNAAGLMDGGQQAEHTALRRGAEGRLPRAESRKIEHGPADDDPWDGQPAGPPLRTPVAAQNPAQVIVMHFNRLGFAADERQQRLNIIAALAGRESVTSTNDLTVAEGIRVKAALEKCRDRGALVELMAAGGTGE